MDTGSVELPRDLAALGVRYYRPKGLSAPKLTLVEVKFAHSFPSWDFNKLQACMAAVSVGDFKVWCDTNGCWEPLTATQWQLIKEKYEETIVT